MSIRVVLADDHTIVREGLRSLLNEERDIQVVAEASDGRAAVAQARAHKPDVVVMDMAMPVLNGMEATRQIVAETDCQVVVLTVHSERQYVSEALRAGAKGYLLKESAGSDVVSAIRAAARGEHCLGAGVADVVMADYVRQLNGGLDAVPAQPVTAREREVLQLIAEGHATREIAGMLHISVKTVETHRAQLLRKLDCRGVADLTKYAIRQGLTELGH